jgi:hypothetical protein
MAANGPVTREERLPKLGGLCQALEARFALAGLAPEQSQEIWRQGVAAECVRCGIHVYGEELYALSQPPSEKYASAKLGRLRLGDCARQGCNSYTYRLTFYPCAALDWQALLASLASQEAEAGKQNGGESLARQGWRLLAQSPSVRRAALGLVLIVLLLAVRQWYIGGRIPLLREPEKFQAAPESDPLARH